MQTETITVELGLVGLRVLDLVESEQRLEIAAEYGAEEATCPRRSKPTWRVHQRRKQRKRDLEHWGKPVWLYLWKRRFRCRPCRYVFTEDDPVRGRRRRSTRRLRKQVAAEALEALRCGLSRAGTESARAWCSAAGLSSTARLRRRLSPMSSSVSTASASEGRE